MTTHTATNGDVELAYETFGAPTGEPLLLIMGTGGQMIDWPDDFCRRLADRVNSREDMAEYVVRLKEITGSPAYPADEARLRDLGRRSYDRHAPDMDAVQRHTAAIAAAGDRRAELARVRVPTLVLHGEDDKLIRVVAGRATAGAIPGARLVTYPGMGHDLPQELWDTFIDEITALARQATAA